MKSKQLVNPKFIPLMATIGLFILMFGIGSATFSGFSSLQNFYYLLIDNAYLIIMATGMTFVIISGGIDLSVGSLLALTTMVTSSMLVHGFSPGVVIPVVLLMGLVFGAFQGYMIQTFNMAPFIVTLGGLYLARGLCYVVSVDTIPINNPFFKMVSGLQINVIGDNFISVNVIIALVVVIVGIFLAHYTKFGRTVYAIGGSEQSALLMGLPVVRTKIQIYALNSFLATLSGIVFTFYMRSGYALHGQGMEMDAIASTVIGGTLLTGGVGYVFGTVFGVLIFGTIQSYINFDGNLNAWWTRIVIGLLVFLFCLLQKIFETGRVAKIVVPKSRLKSEIAK
jgi:simple sugar transport system permease protein